MKHSITTLAITLLFLSACGKDNKTEEVNTASTDRSGFFKSLKSKKANVSQANINQVQQMISSMTASGQIAVPNSSSLPINAGSISQLTSVLGGASGGSSSSSMATALALLNQAGGSGTQPINAGSISQLTSVLGGASGGSSSSSMATALALLSQASASGGQPIDVNSVSQLASILGTPAGGNSASSVTTALALMSQAQSSGGSFDVNAITQQLSAAGFKLK